MSLRNKIEDVLDALDVETNLATELYALVASNFQEQPSQLLLKFAGYTPTLFESAESKNWGILSNLARLVLLSK